MSDAAGPTNPSAAPAGGTAAGAAPDGGGGPAGPSRRVLLTGAIAAVAGAGAGAGVAALLHDDPAPRLAAGSVPGGADGPWHFIEPGGSIQEALDGGATAIALGDGEYPATAPIVMTPGAVIRGIGQRSVVVAAGDLPAVFAVGNGGPVGGVTLADLVVDAKGTAAVGIDIDIVGTAGNLRGEPDAVCRFDNLWVLDAALDGIVYSGTDTQACTTSRVRVRRAGRYGFRIEAPDNTWIACEATTKGSEGAGFYIGVAIAGSNGIGAANLHFHACKAWYCAGDGWQVTTGRNAFVGCESQDTAGHGWNITSARNTFTGCIADSAGSTLAGRPTGPADGFYVVPDDELALVGCLSFDRTPSGQPARQRHGFNVPKGLVRRGLLVAPTGWGTTGRLINERG